MLVEGSKCAGQQAGGVGNGQTATLGNKVNVVSPRALAVWLKHDEAGGEADLWMRSGGADDWSYRLQSRLNAACLLA